jgi:hypothetical protein
MSRAYCETAAGPDSGTTLLALQRAAHRSQSAAQFYVKEGGEFLLAGGRGVCLSDVARF